MQKSINKNFIYQLLKSCSQVIFPLITFPYISRTLTAANVGKVNFGHSIVSYISLIASLGVTVYAVRECSRVREDKRELEYIAGQILSINLTATVLAYIVLGIALFVAAPLAPYRLLIVMLSSTVLFATMGADWINTAMEDFKYITVRSFFFHLLSLLAMFLFVHRPEDYYKYALISVLSSSGTNILNIFYRRRYCRIKFTFMIDWQRHLPPIMLMFTLILSQTIFVSSDITILGIVKGDYEVGLYHTAVKMYNLVNTMIASVAWVVMPRMSYYFAQRDYGEINRLFRYSAGVIVTLGLPCIVGINMLCSEIIHAIAGEEYLGASLSLHILTLALAISLLGGLVGNIVLLPSGKENICLKGCLYAAAANIVLNIILIPKFGLNAAAATTAVSQMIALLVTLKHMDRNIKLSDARDLFSGPVIGAVAIAIICLTVKLVFKDAVAKVLMAAGLSGIGYLLCLLACRNRLAWDMVRPVFSKLKKGLGN